MGSRWTSLFAHANRLTHRTDHSIPGPQKRSL